ncbi:CACTA en-spm transposon protein [Cucumis melo var. makuwa]|uniref:CACTA en-spm transposon protein n=1 Tax=Cucumis melo var. makuwa TaxID=1194695 RepID=A0A5D3C320_CUCMM|nr:CACTA en-spm transposon protein [Cucumis melo var. makuwa]TYK05608.1 CACTA en-spm transposon protein [Cucumis melo var. makuwa]
MLRCNQWVDFNDDAPGAEKLISTHVVRFNQQFFVLNFNDQALNMFVEHQMLSTFKEFQDNCHKHFKKYSNSEEARINPPHLLQKQSYNHSSGSKSFLQRQHELPEQRGKPIDCVELFQQTHIQDETFMSQAAEDAHGTQPLSGDEICETVLGRRPGYSKDLGWGSKPKARKTTSVSSSTTSCSQSTVELQLQAKLDQAMQQIEEQTRNHDALVSKVERMRKLIEDMTRVQQGPPHDP